MSDNQSETVDVRDITLSLLTLSYAHKKIGAALKDRREQGKTSLIPKESVAAISPLDGTVLGTITRTSKDPVAVVVDEPALMAHIHDSNPDGLEDVDVVAATTEQVVAVLKEHAPHLVESDVRIRPYALAEALRAAVAGKPVPGVEVQPQAGTVNTYPAADAGAAIEAVIRSGRVGLDGTVTKLIEGETK